MKGDNYVRKAKRDNGISCYAPGSIWCNTRCGHGFTQNAGIYGFLCDLLHIICCDAPINRNQLPVLWQNYEIYLFVSMRLYGIVLDHGCALLGCP